ncbi:MAG TPA: YezD family protein [Kiritimatiellia bacterium]|nr:YezD family protein [Kiritimatiellia bacterium]
MLTDSAIEEIRRAARDLRFGSIEVVLHDGEIVQINRHEKIRPRTSNVRRPSSSQYESTDQTSGGHQPNPHGHNVA